MTETLEVAVKSVANHFPLAANLPSFPLRSFWFGMADKVEFSRRAYNNFCFKLKPYKHNINFGSNFLLVFRVNVIYLNLTKIPLSKNYITF